MLNYLFHTTCILKRISAKVFYTHAATGGTCARECFCKNHVVSNTYFYYWSLSNGRASSIYIWKKRNPFGWQALKAALTAARQCDVSWQIEFQSFVRLADTFLVFRTSFSRHTTSWSYMRGRVKGHYSGAGGRSLSWNWKSREVVLYLHLLFIYFLFYFIIFPWIHFPNYNNLRNWCR